MITMATKLHNSLSSEKKRMFSYDEDDDERENDDK